MAHMPPVSEHIWSLKYRFPGEVTIADSWERVADALAMPEAEDKRGPWRQRFYAAMDDFHFLPAGRILAGAGTDRDVTLFNCFVMGTIPDDMAGIFTHLREAALTMQQGGGIGYDFSTIRPAGAPVRGSGADASGPVSFMDVWDAMCRTIMSAGHRRGAMMGTLRCDHPDIEAFVDAKRDPERLRMFNLSVLVTDAFMDAIKADTSWSLRFNGETFRDVRARDLWDRIMRATYDYAEPGVIFIDRINQLNNLAYCETIAATNPCGEQPLPPYGACLLGSINLARLVQAPFTPGARLDMDRLRALVPDAVRMLDNAIDVSRFPLAPQAEEARAKRRIGLGVTGLADALIACGVRYGSEDAVRLTGTWLGNLRDSAYRASADLAAEKGPFPLFDATAYLDRPMIRDLPDDIRTSIARHGIRNGLLTSIAPTGTISLVADNVASGIEPVFAYDYTRRVLLPDGSVSEEQVSDYAYRLYRERMGPDTPLSDAFADAQTLSPGAHVAMQAAAQRYIDSAISKTINCPEDIGFDAFKSVYMDAYDSGCKGCTTYRPNPVTGAVLSTGTSASQSDAAPGAAPSSLAGEGETTRPPDLTLTVRRPAGGGDGSEPDSGAGPSGWVAEACPHCGRHALSAFDGCAVCVLCGYSRCG